MIKTPWITAEDVERLAAAMSASGLTRLELRAGKGRRLVLERDSLPAPGPEPPACPAPAGDVVASPTIEVRAPIAGVVRQLLVKPGDQVGEETAAAVLLDPRTGEGVEVTAAVAGTVKDLSAGPDEPVKAGQVLLLVSPSVKGQG